MTGNGWREGGWHQQRAAVLPTELESPPGNHFQMLLLSPAVSNCNADWMTIPSDQYIRMNWGQNEAKNQTHSQPSNPFQSAHWNQVSLWGSSLVWVRGDIDGYSEQSHNEAHSVRRILTTSTSGVRAASFGLVTDCGRPLMTNTLPSLTDEQFLSQRAEWIFQIDSQTSVAWDSCKVNQIQFFHETEIVWGFFGDPVLSPPSQQVGGKTNNTVARRRSRIDTQTATKKHLHWTKNDNVEAATCVSVMWHTVRWLMCEITGCSTSSAWRV